MEPTAHRAVLKRTGAVLIVAGLFDVAFFVYCVVNGISYSSSFNFAAVIAGIFLFRGSLRAASIVRWTSVFMLSGMGTILLAFPFVQPIDLTLTQLRLGAISAESFAIAAFVLLLLLWLYRELSQESVLAARAVAGHKVRDMRIPAAAGVGLAATLAVLMTVLSGGESASRAKAIVAQQLGSTFRYHVSSLQITKDSHGTSVTGIVTAWNDTEIRDVPFQWKEP
jgi:hypothetical protein